MILWIFFLGQQLFLQSLDKEKACAQNLYECLWTHLLIASINIFIYIVYHKSYITIKMLKILGTCVHSWGVFFTQQIHSLGSKIHYMLPK